MKLKKLFPILFAVAAPFVMIACHRSTGASAQQTREEPSPVHTISLPHYQPDLPIAPGRDVFATACLPCHSPRYIIMQPSMPAAKWEAVVKKMMTTYNAPVGDDQIAPIVQYIVAAKENGPKQPWDSLAVETPAELPAIDLSHADATRGAEIFARSCAPCHGATGQGNGSGGKAALPKPTDLTQGRMSPSLIYASLKYGVRGSAMPAAVELSQQQAEDVVAYTLTLAKPRFNETAAAPSAETAKLFAANCVSCHGVTASGDGPAAAAVARRPANFHVKQPDAEFAYSAITGGIPGSTMPAWKTKLDESQRRALAEYVRTFYQK